MSRVRVVHRRSLSMMDSVTDAGVALARLDQELWNLWRGRPASFIARFEAEADVAAAGGEPLNELLDRFAEHAPLTPHLLERAEDIEQWCLQVGARPLQLTALAARPR